MPFLYPGEYRDWPDASLTQLFPRCVGRGLIACTCMLHIKGKLMGRPSSFKDKVSRRPGVETDITTRAIYNESTRTLSGQLRFLSPFPLDAESGSPDTWSALLGKRPSSVRRSIKL